ncbi:hypothetical protein ASD15_14785 [Massilia sp. Root351]|jgi:hypothetical protein|nr:hypothetical protein ASD15_14785 [Massilia sp. Root351]
MSVPVFRLAAFLLAAAFLPAAAQPKPQPACEAEPLPVVVLTGGLHATRTRGNRFNPNFESMTYLLADLKPLALTVVTDGCSAWVCSGPAAAACGAKNWTVSQGARSAAGSVAMEAPSPQFDGSFHVGATTASPPAVSP